MPDCENCDLPALAPANQEIMNLYQTLNTQFVRDFNALEFVFEIFGVRCTRGEAKEMLSKLILVHSIITQHEKEKTEQKYNTS